MLGYAPCINPDQFAAAIAAGDRFLAASAPITPDQDDYHRVLLGHLGVLPAPQLLAELRRPGDPGRS